MSAEYPKERATDRDRLAWFNATWDRWGRPILWPASVALALYVRSHYLEPIKLIPILSAQQEIGRKADSVSLRQRARIETRLDGHDLMFQILVKMQCEDAAPDASADLKRLCRNLPDVTSEEVSRIMRARPGATNGFE